MGEFDSLTKETSTASAVQSRTAKLRLAVALLVVVLLGSALVLLGLSTPGYAGERIANPILQALLQQTPTPVPTPVGAACGVRMIQISDIATDTVSVELVNEGADATIQAVTLSWPTDNGDLIDVRLGTHSIWSGSENASSTTVFPDLAQMLPTIKAGEQTSMTLRFSGHPAEEPYVILLHLGKSCYSYFDSQLTRSLNQSCYVTFDRFSVDEQQARLLVQNTTEESISLKRMLLFWSSDRAAINSVRLDDGENLIAEPAEQSPLELELPADDIVTLQPAESVELGLTFDATAPIVDYVIALQADECQSVFSNVVSPSSCPVRQNGSIQVVDRTVGLVLENFGRSSQSLDAIWMTFPTDNGDLRNVVLNDASIVDQSSDRFPKTSSPASMTAGVDLLPDIALQPNSRAALAFEFDQEAASKHYTIEVTFSEQCRVLSTTRTAEPEPCQVETEGENPIRTEGNNLFLAIRNTGPVQAELRALQIDWSAHFNGSLIGASVADVPFWNGERSEGTATITPNTGGVPIVEPEQTIEVQLTFESQAVPAPYVFRLDFAEGCRLSYATQDDLTMPTPIQVGGTIDYLPTSAFDGRWGIRISASEVLSARVTPQTLLQPQGLTPLVGDLVRATLLPAGENDYLATHIRVFPSVAKRTELTGPIDEIVSGPAPGQIVVADIRVEITKETTVSGELIAGWIAHVEGWERPNGSILADRIETTEPQVDLPRVDFEGVLDDWRQKSETESIWTVSGLDVIVNRDTTIHHGIEPGAPPELGANVWVSGVMKSADTVEAVELWYGPGSKVEEFSGVIRALPDAPDDQPLHGIWIVEDSTIGMCDIEVDPDAAACKQVLVTPSTFLDMSRAIPRVGASVDVSARRNADGSLEALTIDILPEED